MQTRVAQAGPLAAATATKIALAQSPTGAGFLALNGAAGTATANNICTSQSGTASTPLIINGVLKQTAYTNPVQGFPATTIAMIPVTQLISGKDGYQNSVGSPIYITSAGNDSAITFKIIGTAVGRASPPIVISETVTGANASVVASANAYKTIISITPSGNTASTVTVGAMGFATLDAARNVIFTSSGTDTGITITISGTDWAGTAISETVTGGSSGVVASTVLDYLTVTSVQVSGATAGTISVGTNGVCGSPWINLDPWAQGTLSFQCVATGTVNYTVDTSNDDPNSYANPVARSAVTWDTAYAGAATQTGSKLLGIGQAPLWIRVVLNSETGTTANVRMSVSQQGAVPY